VSGFGTSQEAMQAGANAVQEAQQAITGHIGTLRKEVEQMLGGWHGQAASALTNAHNSFEENVNRINSALARMHEALVATHQAHGTQEPDQSQTFTNMNSQVNS
jgi:WXG100 family type VII secretion target